MGKKLAVVSAAVFMAIGIGVWTATAPGQPPKARGFALVDPAGVVTIEWRGAASQTEAWRRTAISQLAEDPDVTEFVNHIAELVRNAIDDAAPDDAPDTAKHLTTLMWTAWERPIGLSLVPKAGPAGDSPFDVMAIMDMGSHGQGIADAAAGLARAFEAMKVGIGTTKVAGYAVTELKRHGKIQMVYGPVGRAYALTTSRQAFERAVRLITGQVKTRPSAKRRLVGREIHADTALVAAYVDLPAVLTAIDANKDEDTKRILAALGINRIEAAGVGLSLYERGFKTSFYLHTPKGRAGLLNLLADAPLDMARLRPVPPDAKGFVAMNLDAVKMLASIRRMVASGGDGAVKDFNDGLADLSEKAGFDVAKDFLPALGHTAIVVQPGQVNLMFFTVPSLVWEVRDRAKLLACMNKAAAKYPAPVRQKGKRQDKSERTGPYLAHRTYAGADIWVLGGVGSGMPLSPAVGLTERHLIVSAFAQDPKGLARRMKRAPANWQGPKAFHDQAKHLRRPLMVATYTDVKDGIKSLMGLFPMVGNMLQEQTGFRPELVPPTEVLVEPMFPAVGGVSRTKQGLVFETYGPLPINLGFADVGSVGLLTALLLPAVTQAREAARRTQCRNNLHQIGLAGHNYHDTHSHFPPATVPNDALPEARRLSWLADILPGLDETKLYNQLDKKKAWDEAPNVSVAKKRVAQYQCPSESRLTSPKGFALSHYAGCLGVVDANGKVIAGKEGIFAPGKPCRIRDIRDGTSQTLWFGQVKTDLGPWLAGGKGTARGVVQGQPGINGKTGFGSVHQGGTFFTFADGSARFISENIDQAVLEALMTRAANEVIDDEDY